MVKYIFLLKDQQLNPKLEDIAETVVKNVSPFYSESKYSDCGQEARIKNVCTL